MTHSTKPKFLLACGVALGPLFYVVVVAQIVTRTGFDISRHPLSLLSLGDAGWIQITNFILTGLLAIACSTLLVEPGGPCLSLPMDWAWLSPDSSPPIRC